MDKLSNQHTNAAVPRRLPELPLPPYSYVSGHYPHPIRDPAGHSYGHSSQSSPVTDENWADNRTYLYGIDLFNSGYYWEAHEAWEDLWHACGRAGMTGNFLKALIKLAAAGVKARERRPAGVRRHAERAAKLFRETQDECGRVRYLGLDLAVLVENAARLAAKPDLSPPTDMPPPVEVLIEFNLQPAAV